MKKISVFLLIILLMLSPSIIPLYALPLDTNMQGEEKAAIQTFQGGSRYPIQGWVYVQIKGDTYERGYQYGYLLYEEILDLMNRWSNMILNHPNIKPFRERLSQQEYQTIASKWWDFIKDLANDMYWDEFPSEYKEEIRGIAAGITDHGGLIHGNPVTYKDVLASNEMYEILSKITDRKIRKGFHPLFSFYDIIKPDIESFTSVSSTDFVASFIPTSPSSFRHKCSSFIATGNATTDGQLIIANSMWSSVDGAGMWWWSYYIAIRWNIILDVIPTSGNRFQMSCAPGYIWSDHDFYQNNKGIVFIETTLPQGIWNEKGLPLAVRARKAVQYANNIDDVISYLRTNNDGVMNAVWLIGDTETGEIARYELGLYHDAIIERTTNGFQWSSNNPVDFGVRWEKMDWKLMIQQLFYHVFLGYDNYQYHMPWYIPASRDIAFEELGKKYYGSIDVDVVKKIMSTEPISTYSPDCKITSSNLVEHNGLWVCTGSPEQKTLSMANFDKPQIVMEDILPVGWVRVFGKSENQENTPFASQITTSSSPTIKWQTKTNLSYNDISQQSILVNKTWYCSSSTGYLYAVDAQTGHIIWDLFIGKRPVKPVYWNNYLFVGTQEGLKKVDLGWFSIGEKQIDTIITPPIIGNDSIFVGTETGHLYAFNVNSGITKWEIMFGNSIILPSIIDHFLVVCSGTSVYGINPQNGIINWQFQTNGIITTSPLISNNIAYIGSWDSHMYAINITSGLLIWDFQTGWGIETTAAHSQGILVFGSHDGTIYAVNETTGIIQWMKRCLSGIHGSPIIIENRVIFGSDDGHVYCMSLSNGKEEWSFAPRRTITSASTNYFTTPILTDFHIYQDTVLLGSSGSFYGIQYRSIS